MPEKPTAHDAGHPIIHMRVFNHNKKEPRQTQTRQQKQTQTEHKNGKETDTDRTGNK